MLPELYGYQGGQFASMSPNAEGIAVNNLPVTVNTARTIRGTVPQVLVDNKIVWEGEPISDDDMMAGGPLGASGLAMGRARDHVNKALEKLLK